MVGCPVDSVDGICNGTQRARNSGELQKSFKSLILNIENLQEILNGLFCEFRIASFLEFSLVISP